MLVSIKAGLWPISQQIVMRPFVTPTTYPIPVVLDTPAANRPSSKTVKPKAGFESLIIIAGLSQSIRLMHIYLV